MNTFLRLPLSVSKLSSVLAFYGMVKQSLAFVFFMILEVCSLCICCIHFYNLFYEFDKNKHLCFFTFLAILCFIR